MEVKNKKYVFKLHILGVFFIFLIVSTIATRMKSSCKMVPFWLSNVCTYSILRIHGYTETTRFEVVYFLTLKSSRKHCLDSLKKKRLMELLLGPSLSSPPPLLSFVFTTVARVRGTALFPLPLKV